MSAGHFWRDHWGIFWWNVLFILGFPHGPDAASGIPWSAVWHPEVGFRRPTRFRAWSTTVSALHGRVAGHHQGPRYEGALLCRWHVHVSTGAADVETAVQRFVSCTERIESWMSSNRLNMNADKTQVIWTGSRQQLAKVDIKEFQRCCLPTFYFPPQYPISVFISTLSRQSAHHSGSCGGNVPLVFLSAEAAADYPKFIDNRCGQDVGTSVCRRSAWLLQQSTVRCQRRTPATSAECPERGSTVHHWYSEIRSHHASVAQPSLVASATKDNFQDRHFDVLMFEWTGTFLSGSCTFQEPEQWHLDRGHSRSAVQKSGTIFPLGWKIHLWVLTHFENCLRHSCLINDCYMSAFAVPVLLALLVLLTSSYFFFFLLLLLLTSYFLLLLLLTSSSCTTCAEKCS